MTLTKILLNHRDKRFKRLHHSSWMKIFSEDFVIPYITREADFNESYECQKPAFLTILDLLADDWMIAQGDDDVKQQVTDLIDKFSTDLKKVLEV